MSDLHALGIDHALIGLDRDRNRRRPRARGPDDGIPTVMARKPLDLPMTVAKAFAKDMRAYHAEPNAIKRDEIAARRLQALRPFTSRYGKKLRITDIIEMFQEMRDQG